MTRYDFLWARWVIVQTDLNLPNLTFGQPDMTSYYYLDEWFWVMFEPTPNLA